MSKEPNPPQPELDLDHSPAMEQAMRDLFNTRWARWHRPPDFDEAMKDPVTKRLLVLTVQHLPSQLQPRRTRAKRVKEAA